VQRFRFRPSQRIRRRRDFERVYRYGQRLETETFTIYFRANGLERDRLGLSISRRRLGGAVRRNRAKRILRELFRTSPPFRDRGRGKAVDMVVAAREAILGTDHARLKSQWREAVDRIRERLSR
jgi:ribonuclease P protein component